MKLARSAAFADGPALAGAWVSWSGASSAFVLATLPSASAEALLMGLPEPARAPVAPRHPWLALRDGARLVWHHTLLRLLRQSVTPQAMLGRVSAIFLIVLASPVRTLPRLPPGA